MRKILFVLALMFAASLTFAQTVKGIVIDDDTDEAVIGASVLVKGTTLGTQTGIDGDFTLSIDGVDNPVLVISYIGYGTKEVAVPEGSMADLGTIRLGVDALGLDEVVVTGTMDIVRDRRTPVAVSTIGIQEIQAKAGNVEFPELLKSTPSIYVANQSGGYGDSEIFTRGFDQTNTAFLLNGQPINGMEDGKMYWSNWSGMTDVASAIQVQRGLGSSKLAISSVGGTTNIIMRTTDKKRGGNVSFLYGNDNYMKATASYSSGMINDKFGISALFTHWQGDGWADGTKGQGQNYFLSAGYKVNDRNTLNFLITGAPQWHDQNYSKTISQHYNDPSNPDEFNIKYNNNWGELNGEYMSLRRNYYHKPVANLNWEFDINETSSLATVLYASWGNGGGTGGYGNGPAYVRLNGEKVGFTADGQINWDGIAAYNKTIDDGIGLNSVRIDGKKTWRGSAIRGSRNNHEWYGLVSNYKKTLSDNVTFNIGADYRWYHGDHFRELVDLLGLKGFDESDKARFNNHIVTKTFKANPWSAIGNSAGIENSIDYYNSETISYIGGFSQLEYSNELFSAFLQGSVSNQNHQRFELHNATEANEGSEKVNNIGYNVKTGASYSINENNTVFFNTGYYQRQPFHDNIYLNYSNTVNRATQSEKIFGMEAGYKFANRDLALNINLYRTSWRDRATTETVREGSILGNGQELTRDGFQNTLQNQIHQGIELDFNYSINEMFGLKGYASVGDWVYDGDLSSQIFDEDRNLVYTNSGDDVSGVKVGGAAQTTFGLGLNVNPVENFRVTLGYDYYGNLYSNLGVGTESLKLPSFGLLDLGLRYNFFLADGNILTLRGNVYNVLGTEYISRARTSYEADSNDDNNWNGVNKKNQVTFGKTRTWNISAKYSF